MDCSVLEAALVHSVVSIGENTFGFVSANVAELPF